MSGQIKLGLSTARKATMMSWRCAWERREPSLGGNAGAVRLHILLHCGAPICSAFTIPCFPAHLAQY